MEINYLFIGVQSIQLHVLMCEAYTSKCAVNRLTIARFSASNINPANDCFGKSTFRYFTCSLKFLSYFVSREKFRAMTEIEPSRLNTMAAITNLIV